MDVSTVPGIDFNSLNILSCWDLLLALNTITGTVYTKSNRRE